MSLPELYLSKPGVCFPETPVDNQQVIARVRAQYRGSDDDWPQLQSAIRHVFGLCRTETRFLDDRPDARVADYAARAATRCLELNDATLDEVDLVICGGIARQYFEPATAMEVAALLGLKKTHAFDVTAACVGHLEAVQTAAAYLHLHEHYRTALVCTAELYADFLDYDIQSVTDLRSKSAGLTVGNAAGCFLLRRQPWPAGGIRLRSLSTHTVPGHWQLCQVPIDGKLSSSSIELMRLGTLIPGVLRECLAKVGWHPTDVDHYVFHQPSEPMVRQIIRDAGGDPERGVYTHALYGNTASASVAVTFDQLLKERTLAEGDKIAFGSAAAGFSVVVATGDWS